MRHSFKFALLALCFTLALTFSALAQPAPAPEAHGIALNHLDRSVNPGDDFYLYANGEWLNQTEIPADRGSVGVFSTLDDDASQRTAAIIEEAAKSSAHAGTSTRKVADLYNSYMNEPAIEAHGLAPLQPPAGARARRDSPLRR
jgi:endothelin-converting enzyme/putative endopeptidase